MYVKTEEKVGIGYRFGMLTVVEKMPIREKSYAVWRCICECGGEVYLDTGTIRNGNVVHCGCKPLVKHGTLDLTGQRFGKLVAIEPTEKRADQGSVVWKCMCDCGKEKEVSASRLKKGKVRSCGCLSNPPLKDYIGKRFGRLTVLEFAGRLSKTNKEIFWRCLCDCGNETIVGQIELQNGDTQSCGCYRRDQIRKSLKLVDGTSIKILENNIKTVRSDNKSGYTGVYREKSGLWQASIKFKGKRYWLGRYSRKEDAIRARQRAEDIHTDFIEWYYSEYLEKQQEAKMTDLQSINEINIFDNV